MKIASIPCVVFVIQKYILVVIKHGKKKVGQVILVYYVGKMVG